MGNIAPIDIVFFVLILLLIVHGYFKGFVEKIFSWGGLVLGIWLAVLLHPAGAAFIRTKIMENVRYVPEILAFVAIFVIVMILVKILEQIFKTIVDGAQLGGINRILGLVFGFVEGLTLTVLIIFLMRVQPIFDVSKVIEDSLFVQILDSVISIPLEQGKDAVRTVFLLRPEIKFPV